ncbi:MAG TPA: ferredoxin [Flavisolibacter sp.]
MAKMVHYRNRCIGCGICFEMQPALWRMSRRDGRATLLCSVVKKQVSVRAIDPDVVALSKRVAAACPARVIKIQ